MIAEYNRQYSVIDEPDTKCNCACQDLLNEFFHEFHSKDILLFFDQLCNYVGITRCLKPKSICFVKKTVFDKFWKITNDKMCDCACYDPEQYFDSIGDYFVYIVIPDRDDIIGNRIIINFLVHISKISEEK